MQRTYLEIGTSDFDTLNEKFKDRDDWCGISVEPVPEYFNRLEKYKKNKYINSICTASSCAPDFIEFRHVPSETIKKYQLPDWLRGCGSINRYHPMLTKYKEHVVTSTLPTIYIEKLIKNYTSTHLDLLKIDTEGEDYNILKKMFELEIYPTHVIFETCHTFHTELAEILYLFRANNYHFVKRAGDSIQFSKKSVLLVVDENWSTGSIAKDLKHISYSKEWNVSLLNWNGKTPYYRLSTIFSGFDSVACFTLGASRAWPVLDNHGIVCCGEVEFESNIQNNVFLPKAKCFGSVSPKIYQTLTKYSKVPIFYTPATARLSRFTHSKPKTPISPILGFCGQSHYKSVKNFELFERIAKQVGAITCVSEKNYNYDTIHKFYQSIDILVCTSSSEGGPLPVFEAIASGIPVISTPVGLTELMGSIPKFKSHFEAAHLIETLKDPKFLYQTITEQYNEFQTYFCLENLLPPWFSFFEHSKHQTTEFI
ncbi:MAG TPA: FkbM family methyltransferase [Candidatus Glassbacteria bacterium]|nr:FkbM family methyltransferase [Candidatus Glassbacteria bacterium]